KDMAELEHIMTLDPAIRKLFEETRRAWINSRYPFTPEEIKADREKMKEKIIRALSVAIKKKQHYRLLYRAAAVLAIPLLMAAGWYLGTRPSSPSGQITSTITAPKGQIAECVLADGTQVWLNLGTTIHYDPSLTGKNRIVNLEGEAYFKVAKMPDRPFIVNTSELQVKVLGTSFNVRAYSDEEQTATTLEEGSIELGFKRLPGHAPIKLTPGECASFHIAAKKLQIEKTDTYLNTAWRDGKYIFKDADLETIVLQLEKAYDVRIHLKNDAVEHQRFRGIFEYKQNIFDALETIERTTSLNYRMDGRDIWLE
ncbi:MAG: FecR domain-containing protein, partial [Mangrovibacterium sp.]|nr:FecR domain-containing protein [Mangrovibacterium sp.]